MSNTNMNPRSSETQSSFLSRLDKNELKSIKVAITRRNVAEPNPSTTLLRSLDDPAQLIVHYRTGFARTGFEHNEGIKQQFEKLQWIMNSVSISDEGTRPIFDRDDIIVNKESAQEERTILSSLVPSHGEQKTSSQLAASRSSSRSSRSSLDGRSPTKFPDKHSERKRASPQPHTSRDEAPRGKEYYSSKHRSGSHSRKAVYKTPSPLRTNYKSGATSHRYSRSPPRYSSRRQSPSPRRERKERSPGGYRDRERGARPKSRSPGGYRGPPDRRRSSRSPPPSHKNAEKGKYGSASPYKYRGPPERKRTRSPPPRRSSRGRSRSHSPYHSRSRYSRSPHHDHRRYERKRSRSPRRHRYSPERHDDRSYQGPRIPNPYFEGAEFWIPDPSMQPRFIPRQMLPPGAFPYGPPFRPSMPMIMPPRFQFRPRIVYNRPPRPRITTPSVESKTTATETVTVTEESANNSETPVKETEHSSPKNSDNDKD